ncbi:hypothetical protein BT69DRAFT_1342341 [Atractiella rhizophila]|nr:hypothetical protein BT69DRAFT_1342341 [Atractiella rhizophila]
MASIDTLPIELLSHIVRLIPLIFQVQPILPYGTPTGHNATLVHHSDWPASSLTASERHVQAVKKLVKAEMRQRVKNLWWIFERDSGEPAEGGSWTCGDLTSIAFGKALASSPGLRMLGISWQAASIRDFQLPLIFRFKKGLVEEQESLVENALFEEGWKMDNLKELTLNPDDGSNGTTHVGRIDLLDLERISEVAPSLETLTVHYLRSSRSILPMQHLAPLTRLALCKCSLRPSDLSSFLLSITPSLRSLVLIHLSSDGYGPADLPTALEPLCLRLETFYWKASLDGGFVGFLDSLLVKMKNLKALVGDWWKYFGRMECIQAFARDLRNDSSFNPSVSIHDSDVTFPASPTGARDIISQQ